MLSHNYAMETFLGTAIVSMTLALVFYSIGTWAERIEKRLRLWHIVFFLLGLCADSFGTAMMTEMADPVKKRPSARNYRCSRPLSNGRTRPLGHSHLLEGQSESETQFQQIQCLCLGLLADTVCTRHRIGHEIGTPTHRFIQKRERRPFTRPPLFRMGIWFPFRLSRQYGIYFSIEKL